MIDILTNFLRSHRKSVLYFSDFFAIILRAVSRWFTIIRIILVNVCNATQSRCFCMYNSEIKLMLASQDQGFKTDRFFLFLWPRDGALQVRGC